jgi:hypothetical protein
VGLIHQAELAPAQAAMPHTTQTVILAGSGEKQSRACSTGGDRIEEGLIRLRLAPMGTSAVCSERSTWGSALLRTPAPNGNDQSWTTRRATRQGHGIGPRRIFRRTPVLAAVSDFSEVRNPRVAGPKDKELQKHYLPTALSAHVMGAFTRRRNNYCKFGGSLSLRCPVRLAVDGWGSRPAPVETASNPCC